MSRTPMAKRNRLKSKEDIAFENSIVLVSEIEKPRSWALYGRSGTGKTTLASTFPKPILLLDIRDRGTDSVADVKGIDVKEVEDWEDIEDTYDYLVRNPKRYKTVILDTVTQLQQLCLEYVLANKRKKSDRAGDWGSMTRKEWGDASAMMKEKITSFRDLPMEAVFIAQEKTTYSEEEESTNEDNILIPEVGPSVMKSVASHLNACVSIIGHTRVALQRTKKEVRNKKIVKEEVRYRILIGPNPIYATKIRKARSITPPAFIEDPSYEDVLAVIKGEE